MSGETPVVKTTYPVYVRKVAKPNQITLLGKIKSRFPDHVKYCFSVSSLHGLKYIIWPNRSPIERLMWICAFVGLTYFGISKGYEVFLHYYERPCVISVEMDYQNFVNEFPSFTFCQNGLDQAYLSAQNIGSDSEMYEYLHDLAFGNYTSYYLYKKYVDGSKKEFLKPEQYLSVLLQAVPTVKNNSDSKDKNNVFPYNIEKPIPTVATEVGICSTLNPSNGIYLSPGYLNSSAPYNYEPITYGHQFTMLKFELRNFSLPYKVALHSADEVVDILSTMHHFRPTTVSIFTVSTLAVWTPDPVKALNPHQRNCRLFNEAHDLDHSPAYTYKLCKINCRIRLCLKHCNCTPYYYRRLNGEKICDMAGMYCLSHYADEIINLYDKKKKQSICNCYQTCNTNTVILDDVSSAAWFRDTRMTIQLLSHPEMRYVRKLVFTKLDLFVQIGGILGLCLGCNILGIIEVVYFMTLRFYWGVIRGKAIKSAL